MSFKNNFKVLFLISIFLFFGSNVFATDYVLKFDGIDDYIDCGNDASLNFGAGNFSYEIWIRGNLEKLSQLLMAHNYDNEEKMLSLVNGKATFAIYDKVLEEWAEVEAPTPVNDGKWHHLVGVYSSSTIMIYVDGDYKAQTDASAVENTDSAEPLTIGNDSTTPLGFEGLIDKVRIYNRVLSPTEIDEHYNGIFENETGLKLNLQMDEGVGSTTTDSSGFGNDGTIYGATYEVFSNYILIATTFSTSTLAYAGQLFTDLSIPIIFAVGLPVGFWIIKKIISLVIAR